MRKLLVATLVALQCVLSVCNALSVSVFNAYNRRNVSAKQFQIVDSAILESNINYFGYYETSVIHIQPEYAVMSQGGSTSSTTLVDVKGNIDGGYGIFTGINSFTKTIIVTEQSRPF